MSCGELEEEDNYVSLDFIIKSLKYLIRRQALKTKSGKWKYGVRGFLKFRSTRGKIKTPSFLLYL